MIEKETLPEFSFWEHIEDLRKRLIVSAISVLIVGLFVYIYSSDIMEFLLKPFYTNFNNLEVVGLTPSEAFTTRILLAIWLGVIISSPIILYQIWLFISPGLYSYEKRSIKSVLIYAILLFLTGIMFAYLILLPFALNFFYSQFKILGIQPTVRVTDYLSMLIKLTLGSGLVFLTPVVSYCLSRFGLLSSQFLIDNSRFFIVAIFILAAILTPPDVLTQIILAGPLLILYGVSILVVKKVEKDESFRAL